MHRQSLEAGLCSAPRKQADFSEARFSFRAWQRIRCCLSATPQQSRLQEDRIRHEKQPWIACTYCALWNKLIAARFRHKQGCVGGIALDLLAQPVDVRFERV